jgi:hypothetical protein
LGDTARQRGTFGDKHAVLIRLDDDSEFHAVTITVPASQGNAGNLPVRLRRRPAVRGKPSVAYETSSCRPRETSNPATACLTPRLRSLHTPEKA